MLMIGKPLTAHQRLEKNVIAIIGEPRYAALAGVLMVGDKRIDPKIRTACTNGRDEVYGEAFVNSLTDPEFRFLILHECYHKLYRHLITWRWMYDEDPSTANQACDYVINIKLVDDNADGFAVMPKVGLLDVQYRGMDAASVYHILRKKRQESGEQGGGQPQDGEGQGGGQPKPGAPSQPQPGQGTGTGIDEHDWEGAKEMDEGERRALERDIDEAIRQGALAAGKLGTGGTRDLEELMQPQVDWREQLRDFVSATCTGSDFSTWQRPNRRFISAGIYMPSGVSETVGELIIAADTSGSIGGRQLTAFLTEIKAICDTVKPDAVRLLYWDTQVCQDERYAQSELDRLVTSTKPAGGGGTLVRCVPQYISEKAIKAQAVIVLTDGYLGDSWDAGWTTPVLWCLLDNKTARPTVGKYTHISSDALR